MQHGFTNNAVVERKTSVQKHVTENMLRIYEYVSAIYVHQVFFTCVSGINIYVYIYIYIYIMYDTVKKC